MVSKQLRMNLRLLLKDVERRPGDLSLLEGSH